MSITSEEQDRIRQLEAELWAERQKTLNLTDAVIGANAAQAQAKKDNEVLFDRLHAVSTELCKIKLLLGYDGSTPHSEIERDLGRPWVGGGRILTHFGGRMADTVKERGLHMARRWSETRPGLSGETN